MIRLSEKIRLILTGAAAGLVCGLFGSGGGMVLVLLLICFCGMKSRIAFASALSVMLPISLISMAVFQITDGLPFAESIPYLIGGLVGGILAGLFYRKIPTTLLHRVMGILILWGGLRLIWNG